MCRLQKEGSTNQNKNCENSLFTKDDSSKIEVSLDKNKWEGNVSQFFLNNMPNNCPMRSCSLSDCTTSQFTSVPNPYRGDQASLDENNTLTIKYKNTPLSEALCVDCSNSDNKIVSNKIIIKNKINKPGEKY